MKLDEINLPNAGIQYNRELNPAIWNGEHLKPEVRQAMLRVAKRFIRSLHVDRLQIKDVVLTGSNANFNWSKFSDFDLHIVADWSNLEEDLAENLFKAKKDIWEQEHTITIKGHEIEPYVENIEDPPVSQGRYSLLHNKWLKKPEFDPPQFNDAALDAKASEIMNFIDRIIEKDDDDPELLKHISKKISKMRQAGLDKSGEYSIENLTFKILRNLGYLDKLKQARLDIENRSLSINEYDLDS